MKSAYELAMERLEKAAPTQKLSEEQKAQVAEIDSLYKSKLAERETFLNGLIATAKFEGDYRKANEMQAELARDLSAINSDWQAKKDKLRESFSK